MTIETTLAALEECGTARNRKIYARRGVKGPMFGVSYADLKTLAKKAGKDHGLAKRLWATGNHDARILATMVADPDALDAKTLDRWVTDIDDYVTGDAFSGLVARTKLARKKAEKWMKSNSDFIGQVGWNIVSSMIMHENLDAPDYFREKLRTIEREIHTRKNRTKHAMNMALCAIGVGCHDLQEEAICVARRIGKVEVDHGETNCRTPNAEEYIRRAAQRKNNRR